jgi:hypothetical protein
MKKLLALFLLLGLALPAHAMVRPMFGIIHGTPSASANRFTPVDGSVLISTSNTGQRQAISANGTIGDLTVVIFAAPGVGTSYAITLQKGAGTGTPADTALTCTISDNATSCSDHTDFISFAPGDTAVWKVVPTGTPAVSDISISSSFTSTTAGETVQPGGGASANLSTSNVSYFPTEGRNTITNIEASTTMFAPTAGSYDNLYVQLSGVATVGSYVASLLLNDATTTLTCTVSTGNSSCNDVTHSVAFVQGDKLAIAFDPAATTPTARVAGWGFRFKPTVDGESIIAGQGSVLSTNANRWFSVAGALANSSANNSTTTAPVAFTMKKAYFYGDKLLSGTQTRSLTLETNGSVTSLSATVTSGNTGAADNTNSASVAQNDLIEWKSTTTNTPSANANFFSMAAAAFIDPGTAAAATSIVGLVRAFFIN